LEDERTYAQRIALVAFWLGLGEGLTSQQIGKLTGSETSGQPTNPSKHTARKIRSFFASLQAVIDLRQDEHGIWSATFPSVLQHPQTPGQRAALLAFELAVHGECRIVDVACRYGVGRNCIWKLLSNLSAVLPIYYERTDHAWHVLDGGG